MIVRRFVKRSLDNQKKLFLILLTVAIASGASAVAVQLLFGEHFNTYVYRDELYIDLNPEVRPVINVNTAGLPIELRVWEGDSIKLECVSELPIIIEEQDEKRIINISQDDSFVVSLLTLDMFRYKLKVYLPRLTEFKEVNIITVGGNVEVDGLHLDTRKVNIETNNASVKVVRAVNVYTITTRSGNIYTDYDFIVSAAIIESYSGNIQIKIPDHAAEQMESVIRANTRRGKVEIIKKDMSLPENYPVL